MIHTSQIQHHGSHRAHQGLHSNRLGVAGRVVASRPRIASCSATSAPATGSTDDTSADRPRRVRRVRLFRSDSSSESEKPAAAAVDDSADGGQRRRAAPPAPTVSEEFKQAFESLGIQTFPTQQVSIIQQHK